MPSYALAHQLSRHAICFGLERALCSIDQTSHCLVHLGFVKLRIHIGPAQKFINTLFTRVFSVVPYGASRTNFRSPVWKSFLAMHRTHLQQLFGVLSTDLTPRSKIVCMSRGTCTKMWLCHLGWWWFSCRSLQDSKKRIYRVDNSPVKFYSICSSPYEWNIHNHIVSCVVFNTYKITRCSD